ncbi:poly(A) polymerase [Methylobacterium sp. Leaf466]|nr:poly(A) polymerase [Methylobacterium sp. Leaf466]
MTGRRLAYDAPAALLRRRDVGRVLRALAVPGEETRPVGGCVRDALLGGSADDLDLATTIAPAAVMALAADAGLRAIPTGIDHGTVTLLADGTAFEVTTLREDVETDGRHAVVRFGRDFGRDAERRDFTINALSLDAKGRLHDTTGGIADLAAGRVRFIGDAPTRIREDALRILRFFRFHARYGLGPPDGEGLTACIAARDAVDGLSRERIRAELLKLLVAPGALPALGVMARHGILERLLASPGDLDRLGRLLAALPQADGLSRLAALAVREAGDVERLENGLRLSRAEVRHLSAYAGALAALGGTRARDRAAMRALLADNDGRALSEASSVLDGEEAEPMMTEEGRAALAAVLDGTEARPVFPVAGADLVGRGVPAGPAVGRGLKAARRRWLEAGCPTEAAAIDDLVAVAVEAAGRPD